MQTVEEQPQAGPAITQRWGGLWQNQDFLKLWAGTTVSLFGSQVTAFALPLIAALTLEATPVQMGLLGAAGALPWMLVGLPAGAWVDRLPRRPILVGTDLGRAALLALIPLAALLGGLRMELLYGVAFLTGILSVIFDVAAPAFLPTLVPRAQFVEGNSKILASASVADIGGPGLAGALVQGITAPLAILVDVVSFLGSAACVALIRAPEPVPPPGARRSLGREIGEGLRLVLTSPLLRPIALSAFTANLTMAIHMAVRVLYAVRELRLEPALLGAVFAAGSVSGLAATVLAGRAARRFGLGPTLIGMLTLDGLGSLLFPLAGGGPVLTAIGLVVAGSVSSVGILSFIILAGSLRQSITPPRLLGRVVATSRFISRSALPLGLVLGGLLGEQIGLRATLLLAGLGALGAVLWLIFSPLRTLREMPGSAADERSIA